MCFMDFTTKFTPQQTCGSGTPAGGSGVTPGMGIDPILVDSRTAAKILAISERKLWQLAKDGDIAHVRIGRSVRYDVTDLRDAVERMKTGGKS